MTGPKLTEGQRKALMWLPSDGGWSDEPPYDFRDTLFALCDLYDDEEREPVEVGLFNNNFVFRLTPAGIEARRAGEVVEMEGRKPSILKEQEQ